MNTMKRMDTVEIGNYLKEIVAFSLVLVFGAIIIVPFVLSKTEKKPQDRERKER